MKINNFSGKRKITLFITLSVFLAFTAFFGIRYGSAKLTTTDFLASFIGAEGYNAESLIIRAVRLPRVCAAILAGIGLSLSGVLLQSVTDNSLAGPNIIGVNSGAGFAVVVFISFFPSAWRAVPIAAFAGAFATTMLIVFISSHAGNSRSSIILAGVAINSLLGGVISGVTLLDPDVLASYNSFSIGGFRGVTLDELTLPAIIIAVSLALSLIFAQKIDLLCIGDNAASMLGVNVRLVRLLCVICASASAAAVVSFAGLLGFVGLIVPHIGRIFCRRFTGYSTASLIVVSALVGGIITVLADLSGRVLAAPSEIPVGIMMSFIGAPFFIALLIKRRSGND